MRLSQPCTKVSSLDTTVTRTGSKREPIRPPDKALFLTCVAATESDNYLNKENKYSFIHLFILTSNNKIHL